MMFCLLYGIASWGAKKSLEREIPESQTPSERGQKRLFLESPSHRFQQEAGLDVEDMRIQSLEAMRGLFVLVLFTALFVAHIDHSWPAPAVSWLRPLCGKLGLKTDLGGLYVLLAGIGSFFAATATLTIASLPSFPFGTFSSG